MDLHTHSSHNPFTTPEGYFDTFTSRMMLRIQSATRPPIQMHLSSQESQPRWIHYMPLWGAACIAGLIVLFTQILNCKMPDSTDQASNGGCHPSWQEASYSSEAELAYDYMIDNDVLYYDNK